MKKLVSLLFIGSTLLMNAQMKPVKVDVAWEKGPYSSNWESLSKIEVPEWALDAKFGIYAHWGIYSIGIGPAWTEQHLYRGKTGTIKNFEELVGGKMSEGYGYKDLLPFFTAEKYDAKEWVNLMKQSGAKFAGFSIGHHDNFGLWNSDVDDWNAGKMGPKRDLYGEFAKELKANTDMKLFCTSHIYRHYGWSNPSKATMEQAKREKWDILDPKNRLYYQNKANGMDYTEYRKKWKLKMKEIMDKYEPDVIWYDGAINQGIDHLEPLAHYFNKAYNQGKEVVVANKYSMFNKGFDDEWFNFPNKFGWLNFEQGRDRPVVVPNERYWSEDFTITGKAWSYTMGSDDLSMSSEALVRRIIDITARGGCVMVSLCPKADGSIPQAQQDCLIGTGKWLKDNGEAIFATRMWDYHSDETIEETQKYIHKYSDNKPNKRWFYDEMTRGVFRYTRSKDRKTIYAITMGLAKETPKIIIAKHLGTNNKSVSNKIKSVELLGHGKVTYKQTSKGLEITLPKELPNTIALAFKISMLQ